MPRGFPLDPRWDGSPLVTSGVELGSDPTTVAVAREYVRTRLATLGAGQWTDDAILVASELVTNAVLHTKSPLSLALERDKEDSIRIEVYDGSPTMPLVRSYRYDSTNGRGLALVSALSCEWGSERHGAGKVVWARIGGNNRGPLSSSV